MIPNRSSVDQPFLAEQRAADPLIQRYRAFFDLFEWSLIASRDSHRLWPGPEPHPETAYIKALLVKLCEGKPYITQLRSYLLDHPLLVIELGFRPVLDASQPLGFDLQRTIPCDRWLRFKQQYLDHSLLQDLLAATVQTLLTEIPGLGETIAVDVKHIYAWVQENNPRVYRKDRFCKDQQPTGDPDCKVGVKKSTNQEQPDGSKKVIKEYLWGYGSGVAAATNPVYGDVVLAEFTQPFNEGDVTYYLPVYRQAVVNLGFFPLNITADAAFDAWYVYQTAAHLGGIAAIAPNQHGHLPVEFDRDGVPLCPKGFRMHPTYGFDHPNGYRAQRYRCPLLFPQKTGQSCNHAQFLKGKGCVKDINLEDGGVRRHMVDRSSPQFKAVYRQRTSAERINSQAKELGIERPRVRNRRSVENLNTLIYLIINARALQKAKAKNSRLLQIR